MNPHYRPDPADALRELALDAAPPSRMDITRAAQDGFQLRRRRQLTRSMTGVAAAGVVAAVAVLLPAHLHDTSTSAPTTSTSGTASPKSTTTCPTVSGEIGAAAGADYRAEAPGGFGWLPSEENVEISETVTNPQAHTGATASDPFVVSATYSAQSGVGIYLSVYAYAAEVPGQHAALPPGCPSNAVDKSQVGGFRIPAPDVNGRKAYWFTLHQGSVDDGGTAQLVWQTSSGTWTSVTGTNLEPDTVQSTLEHVAETATVGVVPVTAPVQIKNVPATARMQFGQLADSRLADGTANGFSGEMTLTFGTGVAAVQVEVWIDTESPMSYDQSCERVADQEICVTDSSNDVSANSPGLSAYLPGGMNTLLQDLVGQGANPSSWSADLVTGTK